ncbi:hypothetical protein R1flu_006102 [Riccia fluitans]|uniref:Uncharacterized protein n=1 Tax=Riccia fluitans TaxID=41844 RepID=A0ABD1YV37_9MARC
MAVGATISLTASLLSVVFSNSQVDVVRYSGGRRPPGPREVVAEGNPLWSSTANCQLAVLSPQVRWENFRRWTCLLALDALPDFTAEACYSGFSRAGTDWEDSLGM